MNDSVDLTYCAHRLRRPLHRLAPPILLLAGLLFLATGCVSLTPYPEVVEALPEEEFVTIDGEKVHVVQWGVGEPVVLLHGFGASAWSWREVTPGLAEAGYRTVAIDLFGFGATERTGRLAAYTRGGQVEMVLGVMDELGIDRAHLVGHSYGGALAQTLTVEHPERVRSLVLVNSARPDYPLERRTPLGALEPVNLLYLRTFGLRPASVRRALENSVADPSVVTDELVVGYRDRLAVQGAARAYKGLTRPRPGGDGGEDRPVPFSSISAPTLVVWGQEDMLIPIDAARERSLEIPDSRFIALPDVGHLPMEESPERLTREIKEFLGEGE